MASAYHRQTHTNNRNLEDDKDGFNYNNNNMKRTNSDDDYEMMRSVSVANIPLENQYASKAMEGIDNYHHHEPIVPNNTSTSTSASKESFHKNILKTAFEMIQCVIGIYASFMIMGYYQEQITRRPYGGKEQEESNNELIEYFNYPLFLVFLQCVLNSIVAYFKIKLYPSEHGRTSKVPTKYYLSASFAYVCAVASSNAALVYVNYPTQVLAKSCKMIPVMLMGIIVARKSYPFSRIVAVLMTSIGISIFMIDRFGHKQKHTNDNDNNIYGLLLLVFSLAADGFTNSTQDLMRSLKDKPTADELMLYMNSYASIFVGVAMLWTGQFLPAIDFCIRHHAIISHIAIFCVTMAAGQIFIFWCIASFGTLILSIITTTRKFFTILWSVFSFGHEMSNVQWIGVLVVFIGLMYDIAASVHKEHKKSQVKSN
ncbi:hypothetical protein ABK040_002922 [Willaertia magna]